MELLELLKNYMFHYMNSTYGLIERGIVTMREMPGSRWRQLTPPPMQEPDIKCYGNNYYSSTMVPSIILLLVRNDFIGAKELGVLACASQTLQQYICLDSDEELWSYLLRIRWPNITQFSSDDLCGLSNRGWYQNAVDL